MSSTPTPAPAAHWQAARPCRWCSEPLTALQRLRGDSCDRLPCRARAGRESALRQRDAALLAQRTAAARRWGQPAVAEAPVVWLERHETRLVPLPAAQRRAQRDHLQALADRLAAEPAAAPAPATVPDAAAAESDTPLAGPLCTFCAGRCCRYGAGSHAFVTPLLLRRWLARHPGRTAHDAAAAYLALLPRHHVEASCVHHGARGCTLPREMRSDICNGYACDALRKVQDAAADPPPAMVAAMERAWTLGDVALLEPGGHRRLPRRLRTAAASKLSA